MVYAGIVFIVASIVLSHLHDKSKRFEEYVLMYLNLLVSNGLILNHSKNKEFFFDIAQRQGLMKFRTNIFAYLSFLFFTIGVLASLSHVGSSAFAFLLLPFCLLLFSRLNQAAEKEAALLFIAHSITSVQDRIESFDSDAVNSFLDDLIRLIKSQK